MTGRKGLTWSKKWHIVDESKVHEGYDIALCGAYLYNPEKEQKRFRGARMPEHLQNIIDGTKKSAGECKNCSRSAGVKTVTVELTEPQWDNHWTIPSCGSFNGMESTGDSVVSVELTECGIEVDLFGELTPEEARLLVAAILSAIDAAGVDR